MGLWVGGIWDNQISEARGSDMDEILGPSRRQALALAGGAVLVAVLPFHAEQEAHAQVVTGPATLAEFMELSEALTDEEFSLRDEVGAQYLAALEPAAITRLVQVTVRSAKPPDTFADVLRSGALDDATNAVTAQQILIYWYSGLVANSTADYLEALAWETLDFAAVASTPLGFPKWERQPS